MATEVPEILLEGQTHPEDKGDVPAEIQDEFDRQQREVLEKILDKAASDAAWKEKFLDTPEQALEELGVKQQLDDLNPLTSGGATGSLESDVSGQSRYYTYRIRYCLRYTTYILRIHYR